MTIVEDPSVPASLEQHFCFELLRAARAWRRVADAAAIDFGLSEATAYPLVVLWRLGDGLRQTALAEAVGIEGPSLVRLLDHLSGAGLVERREDARDKRAKTLHLTPRGRALVAGLTTHLDAARARAFADCGRSDVEAALRVFAALGRAAAELR